MEAKAKLSDGDIKEVKKGRRAFLLAGLGATGLLAALTAQACWAGSTVARRTP